MLGGLRLFDINEYLFHLKNINTLSGQEPYAIKKTLYAIQMISWIASLGGRVTFYILLP